MMTEQEMEILGRIGAVGDIQFRRLQQKFEEDIQDAVENLLTRGYIETFDGYLFLTDRGIKIAKESVNEEEESVGKSQTEEDDLQQSIAEDTSENREKEEIVDRQYRPEQLDRRDIVVCPQTQLIQFTWFCKRYCKICVFDKDENGCLIKEL